VRTKSVVQVVLLLAVIAALVLGVIVCAVLGAGVAAWNRQYPYATKKRRFTRDSSSQW